MFILRDSDSYADANVDSCTEKVIMDVNGMAPRLVLNGCRTNLFQPRSQSRSSGNTSEHYH